MGRISIHVLVAVLVAAGATLVGRSDSAPHRPHDLLLLRPSAKPRRRSGRARERGRGRAGTYDFGVYPLYVKEEGGRLRFYVGPGRPTYTLVHQGGHAFAAEEDPDAIRLTFSVRGGRADKLLLRMASMHRHAEPRADARRGDCFHVHPKPLQSR